MVADIVQAVSIVAVVVSLFFVAVQTSKLKEQTDISNLIGRYETLNHASERYDAALGLLFQQPHLRPYLFDEQPVDLIGDDLSRGLIVADLMVGAADYALRVAGRFADTVQPGWEELALDLGRQPLVRKLLDNEAHSFPDLVRFLRRIDAG
jgi:hypothetical protein